MNDQIPSTSWYVSRRVELPLNLAADAFDLVVGDPHATESVGGLADAFVVAPATALPVAGRHRHGRLRTARLRRPLPVELELTPWSHTQSELGLRPRRPPAALSAERYWHSAALTLERLHARLLSAAPTGSAEEPLRRAS